MTTTKTTASHREELLNRTNSTELMALEAGIEALENPLYLPYAVGELN